MAAAARGELVALSFRSSIITDHSKLVRGMIRLIGHVVRSNLQVEWEDIRAWLVVALNDIYSHHILG